MSFNWGAAGIPATWLYFHGRRRLGALVAFLKWLFGLYMVLVHFPYAVAATFLFSIAIGFWAGRREGETGWTVAGVIILILRLLLFGGLAGYYRKVGNFSLV